MSQRTPERAVASTQLVLSAGGRVASFGLLLTTLCAFLVADSMSALLSVGGSTQAGVLIDAALLVGYVACGSFALHPSMTELARREGAINEPLGPGRLALLTVASLLAPLVLLLEEVGGEQGDGPVIAAASGVLFLLVSARLALVIRAQRRTEAGLRESEDALRISEARYRTLAELASDGIIVANQDGRLADANRAACAILGYSREELLTLAVNDLVPRDPEAELNPRVETLVAGGTILSERTFWRRDGSSVPLEVSARMLPDGQFHGVIRDISERRAAESERSRLAAVIEHAAAAFRSVFENNPAPMWVYATDSLQFLAANDAAVRTYGYSRNEFLAMTIADIRPPDELERLQENIQSRRFPHEISGPWRHRHRDGTIVEVEVASHEIEFDGLPARLVLITDVTERRTLENQLRQAQKMEAIGRLAGGVAHDFNNLVTAIRGYAELSRLSLDPADEVRGFQDEILRAADRAKTLTGRLLTFARKHPSAGGVIDLATVLRDLTPMLRQVVDERVRLSIKLPPDAVLVNVEADLIEQAVLNLVINARDATVGPGMITIGLATVELGAVGSTAPAGLRAGRYARVSVSDTGRGIAPEHLSLIFDPFFTTKPANEGTGLGLSMVYSIATGAGGTVLVESEPDRGTRFDLVFPLASSTDPVAPTASHAQGGPSAGGSESLLLVEDEPAIRAFVARVLTAHGYQVVAAESAEQAIALVGRIGPPAALITDVLLPAMNGTDLATELRRRLPGLAVLFVSGYDGDHLARDGTLDDGTMFLGKPFSSSELLDAVRSALDAPYLVAARPDR